MHVKSAIEILHERAEGAVRELVARAPGGSIRAAFAGGSLGRGEVWSGMEGSALAIYSDVDVYVVLSESVDEDAVRRVATAVAAELVRAPDAVVFHRGIDMGLYRLGDLVAQPVRPGTVDLAEHHVWLYGDRAVLDALRAAPRAAMAPAEALYLLENRAWDALDAVADATRAPRRAQATAAKVVLDVGAAHLIVDGSFRPTIAARVAALRERAPASLDRTTLETIANAEQVRLGVTSARLDETAVLATVADAWWALASRLLHSDTPATTGAASLLAKRCHRGESMANYREFARLRRRAGLSLAAAAIIGWRFASLAPVTALRTHALARAFSESARETTAALRFHTAYVAGLASRLGCTDGSLDERARAALRAVS